MLWHITLSNKTDIIFSILYYYAIKPKYHHHSNKNDNRQRKILFKGSCQESGLRFWRGETKKFIFGKRNNSSFLSYNNDTICFLRKLSDRWPPFSNHFRCRPFKNQVPGGHMWNLEYENHLTTLVVVVVVSLIGKKSRHSYFLPYRTCKDLAET